MRKELTEILDGIELNYSAVFVPQSRSRTPDQERINWRIKLGPVETDYSEGIGHLPKSSGKDLYLMRRTLDVDSAIKHACETGRMFRTINYQRAGAKKLDPPKMQDVLYSLVGDSDAIEYPTFEDWACSLGYDEDSRSAEAIYRACLDIGLKLRVFFGDARLAELRWHFLDY